MRKIITAGFMIISIFCGILFNAGLPVSNNIVFDELSPSMQDAIIYVQNNPAPSLTVSFSHQQYFYDETICLSISASHPDAKIYYTTNGSTPTQASKQFDNPLNFVAEEAVKCIVLKAFAINGTEQSPVLTHSFFIGQKIDERFSTYVFSVSSDPDGLYGYHRGILVPGKIYDDYMAQTPEADLLDPWNRPANYAMHGREWERPIYIEAFTQDGKRVVAQNAGMRVHGAATRVYQQKSLRLIARKEYEPDAGKFNYNFFGDYLNSEVYAKPIMSYDTLILRNDGNDFSAGRLRTPLASSIAHEAGFPAVSPLAAAAVFINGEYYGYATLNVRINEQFLQDVYNVPGRDFEIVDGGSSRVFTDDENTAEAFNQLLKYANDGFDDSEMLILDDFFDLENLLFYYAFMAYIGKSDWPDANMQIWRYTGPADPDYPIDELDGRWRFLMWDLENSMHYNELSSPDTASLHSLIEERSPILQALLQRPEYAEKFANNLCDLMSDHFSVTNTLRVIQELNDMGLQEQQESLLLYGSSYESFLQKREQVIAFIEQRPQYILAELRELFGFNETYRITSDGSAKINTINGNAGVYFIENSVPVSPVLEKGHVFDHWLVNGEKRYAEDLLISFRDADVNGTVYVQLVTREAFSPLFFVNTYDTGDLFGFTMTNPTDSIQNTQGLYLSDNIDDLKKWAFPSLNIRAGSTWEFVGRNSTSIDSLLKIGLNFNPRYGEVVFLSNEEGIILDYIVMKP